MLLFVDEFLKVGKELVSRIRGIYSSSSESSILLMPCCGEGTACWFFAWSVGCEHYKRTRAVKAYLLPCPLSKFVRSAVIDSVLNRFEGNLSDSSSLVDVFCCVVFPAVGCSDFCVACSLQAVQHRAKRGCCLFVVLPITLCFDDAEYGWCVGEVAFKCGSE